MNVSINPPGSQLYVDISSLAAHLATANGVEDVHICGACKRNFSDIELFLEHKRTGCSTSPQKTASSSVVPSHTSSPLGFETNTSSNNDDNISSLGPQYLRVIFEGENLNIDEEQTVDQQLSDALPCSSCSESDILRNRLLGLAKPVRSEANHSFSSSNDLHTLVLDNQQSNTKAREFHLDEEDVATLLANQLASEVVNTGDETSDSSKTGLIDISSDIGTKSNEHFVGLQSVNISIGTVETGAKDDVTKRASEKKICLPTSQISSGSMGEGNEWIDVSENAGNKNNTSVPVSSVATQPSVVSSSKTCINDLKESVVLPDGPSGRKRYKCNHESCDFTSVYLKDLVRHVRKHTGEKPFACFSCYRTFSRLDKLHVHERIHTGEKKYQCTVCEYATRDSGSLRKHMRVHNDERPYKCQMCSYRSRDSSQLTVHLRTHTGDHPFVCPFESCTSAFKTSSDLKRHSRTHTGEKPFVCPRCDYKSSIKSNLSIHMRHNHSESKTFSCNSCKLVCSTKRELKDHEKTHAEILKCGLCSFTCIGMTSMKNHLKVFCGEKALSCKLCSFTTQSLGNLKIHVKKKHSEGSRKKPKGSSDKNQIGRSGIKSGTHLKPSCVKSYKCTFCEEAYVREDSWRSHMRQHKNSTGKLAVPGTNLPPTAVMSVSVESTQKLQENNIIETTSTVEISSQPQKEDESSSSNFMEINYNENSLKEDENSLTGQIDKVINDNVISTSEIDSSFVQYSVEDKNDKGEIQIVHQVNSEVLDRDNLSSQPILFYVQNAPVLHGGLDSSLRNAEILASINPPAPILVSRCGQYVSLPLEQGGSLVEQFTSSSLPQGMQYIVSAPFEGVVGNNTAFLQPVDSAETSGNPVSVVSFQLDKGSSVPVRESRN